MVVVGDTGSEPKPSLDQRPDAVPGATDLEVNEADKVPALVGQRGRQMLTKNT